jgi:hypothetical protein
LNLTRIVYELDIPTCRPTQYIRNGKTNLIEILKVLKKGFRSPLKLLELATIYRLKPHGVLRLAILDLDKSQLALSDCHEVQLPASTSPPMPQDGPTRGTQKSLDCLFGIEACTKRFALVCQKNYFLAP